MVKYVSKYRHVYADDPKSEGTFSDLPLCATDGEGNFCSASSKFIAVGKAGSGAPVIVLGLNDYGRKKSDIPVIATHSKSCKDMAFHPVNPYLLATGGDDACIHLNVIPKGGLTKKITEPHMNMSAGSGGHKKKISLLAWNRASTNVLASGAYDRTVKVWDASTGEAKNTLDIEDNIFSLKWDKYGTELGFLCKTAKGKTDLYVTDPRTQGITGQLQAFSKKTAKMFFKDNWVGAFGFKDGRKRYLRIWDRRKFVADEKILDEEIDNQSSTLMPHYDEDTNLLWVYGRGSGSVNFWELGMGKKAANCLGGYRNSKPIKGGCFIPKVACNTSLCEIARFMKLEVADNKLKILPIQFRVPRKSDLYQEDIYPDTYAGRDLLSPDDWFADKNLEKYTLRSMNPDECGGDDEQDFKVEKKLTYKELAEENKNLKKRIAELESQLGIEKKTEEEAEEAEK